jgi:hypothetical protein
VVFDWAQTLRGVAGVVAVGGGFDGLAAPAGLLADLVLLLRGMFCRVVVKEAHHFVHWYGAVGYCDEADYDAEDVVPFSV